MEERRASRKEVTRKEESDLIYSVLRLKRVRKAPSIGRTIQTYTVLPEVPAVTE